MFGRAVVYTGVVLAMVFWSLSFIWGKTALETFNPISVIFLRVVFASVFLLLFTLSTRKLQRIKPGDLKLFLLMVFFEPFLYFLGETTGLSMVSPVVASVIISTIPLVVPFAAFLIMKERMSVTNLVGITLSIIGVVLVILNKQLSFEGRPLGVALVFLAVASAVGYTLLVRKLVVNYTPLTITTYQNIFGALAFIPVFFGFDFHNFITVDLSFDMFIPIIKLSIFASSLSFIFFANGVDKIGLSKANTFGNMIPVFTAIFAYFMMGEELTAQKIAGILIVIAGLFISQINFLDRRKAVKVVE